MKKRIITYRQRIDALLAAPESVSSIEQWHDILQEHLIQIGFFQHERLIHYGNVCDTYTYFDSCIACDLSAVTFCIDAIAFSIAYSIYQALLYFGE